MVAGICTCSNEPFSDSEALSINDWHLLSILPIHYPIYFNIFYFFKVERGPNGNRCIVHFSCWANIGDTRHLKYIGTCVLDFNMTQHRSIRCPADFDLNYVIIIDS